MFPHTITIYHHDLQGDTDIYTKQVVAGFYSYGSYAASQKAGSGTDESGVMTMISNAENAADYLSGKLKLETGDRIIIGKGENIRSYSEIEGRAYTVTGIELSCCGSPCDNLTIKAR